MKLKHDFTPDDAVPAPAGSDGKPGGRGWAPEAVAIGLILLGLWIFALVRFLGGSFTG